MLTPSYSKETIEVMGVMDKFLNSLKLNDDIKTVKAYDDFKIHKVPVI